ncbi:hypothetical protein YC2023_118477 [Brassica napus]|uniref:Uncharacterized protein n=1 Tax=Brassica oleracea TaxID=3712 RepID=A0A3P6EE87_BRAOL|nr:unnamed protein product [Brassica oleracea]
MEEVAAGIIAANTSAPLAPDTSLSAETVDQRITSLSSQIVSSPPEGLQRTKTRTRQNNERCLIVMFHHEEEEDLLVLEQ